MNRNTSLLTAVLLGAVLGAGAVWWAIGKKEAPAAGQYDSAETPSRSELQASVSGGDGKPSAPVPTTASSGDGTAIAEHANLSGSGTPFVADGKEPAADTEAISSDQPTATGTSPGRMRLKELPGQATVVDQVVVPVPSEIFAALERVGRPRWKEVLRPFNKAVNPRTGAEETALLLGNVIAEGFIAVEAENAGQVRRVGQSVLNLSAAIGVRKTVIARSNAILQSADRRDWPRVRTELDRALADVKAAMQELNSEALADLVSLGGWLRGAEALAAVTNDDFNPESAELLHQPGLVRHFTARLQGLPVKSKNLEVIIALDEGLKEIRPLIAAEAPLEKKQVADILEITKRLTKRIEGKNGR
jgi:hypothetical protein